MADALTIGVWQCLALIPGISRSGVTIIGGLLRGVTHEGSAHFSFLIATPIIIGATVLEVPKLLHEDIPPGTLQLSAIAAVVAGIVALLSTAFLMRYFRSHDRWALNPFAYYCIAGGLLASATWRWPHEALALLLAAAPARRRRPGRHPVLTRQPALVARAPRGEARPRAAGPCGPGVPGRLDHAGLGKHGPPEWRDFAPQWQRFYGDRNALNLGFKGDTTASLIWRMQHGELDGISPKAGVVLIGANNNGRVHWSADADAGRHRGRDRGGAPQAARDEDPAAAGAALRTVRLGGRADGGDQPRPGRALRRRAGPGGDVCGRDGRCSCRAASWTGRRSWTATWCRRTRCCTRRRRRRRGMSGGDRADAGAVDGGPGAPVNPSRPAVDTRSHQVR